MLLGSGVFSNVHQYIFFGGASQEQVQEKVKLEIIRTNKKHPYPPWNQQQQPRNVGGWNTIMSFWEGLCSGAKCYL